jgi:hypothetical protein
MTNTDLALIIESTSNLIAKKAPNSERYQPLIAQFKELLQEQLRRAKESK